MQREQRPIDARWMDGKMAAGEQQRVQLEEEEGQREIKFEWRRGVAQATECARGTIRGVQGVSE